MTLEEMKKKFPSNFPVNLLDGIGIYEESIKVYRVCRTGAVEQASFLPTFMDELSKTKEFDPDDVGSYSLSTYYKLSEAKKRLRFFLGLDPQSILAEGFTDPKHGPCQRTKERTGTKSSHVDWWLYENAEPHIDFNQVEL